ncbi:hypothetical protein SBOR_6755 [Sclerotinia borealis F-4128]|uniref:Uncharacterized protein n=1 Tax=Sclerotinia borealis (strain F-4128) TaxID=1432307 RepID=W9C7Y8_SCLBF|nr:hypothetical protein SBOR_6755 [Sclerotinia borealis F-4128]
MRKISNPQDLQLAAELEYQFQFTKYSAMQAKTIEDTFYNSLESGADDNGAGGQYGNNLNAFQALVDVNGRCEGVYTCLQLFAYTVDVGRDFVASSQEVHILTEPSQIRHRVHRHPSYDLGSQQSLLLMMQIFSKAAPRISRSGRFSAQRVLKVTWSHVNLCSGSMNYY